jgi:hypothetical protein
LPQWLRAVVAHRAATAPARPPQPETPASRPSRPLTLQPPITRARSPPRQKAVKFTECMRANGVGDFPDPDASGQFPSYGVSVTPTVWTKAVVACKSLQPPGTLSAKLTPAQESAALKFAHCVRANGVPDFPDPVDGQPLIDTTRIPSANKPGGMTILNAATHKCGHFIAEQMGGH